MSWLKRMFGGEEEKPSEAPATLAEPVAPVLAKDEAVAVADAARKKVKLNFKKIPKQVLAEMAAETTGQPQVIVVDPATPRPRKGGLTDAFNDAVKPTPAPKMPMRKAPTL